MNVSNSKLSIGLVLAMAVAGCATTEEPGGEAPEIGTCEGATTELGATSCAKQQPVTADGLAPGEQAEPRVVPEVGEDEAAKAVRSYAGSCTGIWYGCSRVQAEGWTYESCGTSHYVYMNFDGAYGNLVGYGIGYCWF